MNKPWNSLPDATLFVSIAVAIVLNAFMPFFKIVNPPFTYLGWLLIFVGIIAAFKSLALLKKFGSTDVVVTSNNLISKGLFLWSRNPLYAAELIIVIGVAVALGSLSAFFAPLAYFLIINYFVIPYEETQLANRFGSEYKKYKHSVRRWF